MDKFKNSLITAEFYITASTTEKKLHLGKYGN
jgi:hypothetical protein